jgi:hypothetical protein
MMHFRVAAREMLFDQPECCPTYGGLFFDGLAIDGQEGRHLIVREASARAYLGPELPDVASSTTSFTALQPIRASIGQLRTCSLPRGWG